MAIDKEVQHDAELRNWAEWNGRYAGNIYGDRKGRFTDGTYVHTSPAVSVEGDILTTRNTVYKLVDKA